MWYSGLVVLKSFCEDVLDDQPLLQMKVVMVDADDEDDALTKLKALAVGQMEIGYINADGHWLQ